MGGVRAIKDEKHFQTELAQAVSKLVVVDFSATWCGPCQTMVPVFKRLAAKYIKAVFLKIDVDQCPETAVAQGVSAMPSFMFYRNRTKVHHMQGADPTALETKIVEYYRADEEDDQEEEESI